MDGNRRWAKAHALDTFFGHRKGSDMVDPIMEYCADIGIETVSFWCLAKKNIQERSERELAYLYDLFIDFITEFTPKLLNHSIKLEAIGNLALLPERVQNALKAGIETTKDGTRSTCVLALGYGGQDEIVRGVQRAISEGIDPSTLDERTFAQYLDSGKYPPPDLIIRTGGDTRHSGFYLYGCEYSEYAFTNTLWPDFAIPELQGILENFGNRKRNFGK